MIFFKYVVRNGKTSDKKSLGMLANWRVGELSRLRLSADKQRKNTHDFQPNRYE
jgi:hypothetical protein